MNDQDETKDAQPQNGARRRAETGKKSPYAVFDQPVALPGPPAAPGPAVFPVQEDTGADAVEQQPVHLQRTVPAPRPERSRDAAPRPERTRDAEPPVAAPEDAAVAAAAEGTAAGSSITLWGGIGSGKSTLLAALTRAVLDPQYGAWNVFPEDHVSKQYLNDLAHTFYRERVFPSATQEVQRPIQLTLVGDVSGTPYSTKGARRRWRRSGTVPPEVLEFRVTLRDMPGEAFDLRTDMGALLGPKLIADLADSRGMVYVLDAAREWRVNGENGPVDDDERQSADFFTEVLDGVATEVAIRKRRDGHRLPHSIAVCLAKFDDEEVFRFACETANVRLNPRTGQPEAIDAKQLFDDLCDRFPHGSLGEVRTQIERYFVPERVGYFVCSAVGFWVNPEHGFDFDNPSLVNPVENKVRFAAPPRPVNVMEPFLFLRGLSQRG
ncbi:hypothetical protein [Streptomyces fructofermentans]|uniref:Uncharacterized protein n=1 Tax=Streptomyces fructofermentans TaxID=152141 RepID=A0A918K1M6_9ACTN|nr:hypothetical protein [Streptomyces fructofermentans]GGX44513.1 hypothetical protein GCM10010515_09250 [Streptomyces fructofermentans]